MLILALVRFILVYVAGAVSLVAAVFLKVSLTYPTLQIEENEVLTYFQPAHEIPCWPYGEFVVGMGHGN